MWKTEPKQRPCFYPLGAIFLMGFGKVRFSAVVIQLWITRSDSVKR